MSELETVQIHRRGAAATIVLHRPDSMNAFDGRLAADVRTAVDQLAADDDVRVVCLTGGGRGFSSGVDLKSLGGDDSPKTADGTPDVHRLLVERYHPIITALRTMPKPVVSAVNGPAVGVGMSMALAADLVVARESAYFLLAFVNIGLAPDGGASLFVPERIGFTRAAEMAMLGERVHAPKALEWGLVNEVFADDEFDAGVAALLDRLAAGATRSYAGIKRQLNRWLFERMDGQLDLEARVQQEMAETADFAEGVTAFLEKRPAEFRGR